MSKVNKVNKGNKANKTNKTNKTNKAIQSNQINKSSSKDKERKIPNGNKNDKVIKVTDVDTSANDIFCERCDNILDISRTPFAEVHNEDGNNTPSTPSTPSTLSTSTSADDTVNYESILKKVENGEKLSDDELKLIDIKDLAKNEYYKKMSKKGEIKKQIADMIEDMGNSDENVRAYMVCHNCGFTKPVIPKFKILTKNPEGVAAEHEYVNEAAIRNRIHMRTMPRTREFTCPNPACPTHTQNVPTEAIFFRKSANTYDTIYVCVSCKTVKVN